MSVQQITKEEPKPLMTAPLPRIVWYCYVPFWVLGIGLGVAATASDFITSSARPYLYTLLGFAAVLVYVMVKQPSITRITEFKPEWLSFTVSTILGMLALSAGMCVMFIGIGAASYFWATGWLFLAAVVNAVIIFSTFVALLLEIDGRANQAKASS